MGKYAMTWADVERSIDILLGQFKSDGYVPRTIVGVSKGGVIPASLIHQVFPRARFDTIGVRSYTGEFISEGAKFTQDSPPPSIWNDKYTLIVDDIIETGGTSELLRKTWPNATQAFMVCRHTMASKCYYRGLIYGPGWIDFPWERKIDVEAVKVPF